MNHRVALGDALRRNRCVRVGSVRDCLSKMSFWRRAENLSAIFRENRFPVNKVTGDRYLYGGLRNKVLKEIGTLRRNPETTAAVKFRNFPKIS